MGSIGRLGLQSRIENLLLQLFAQDSARTFPRWVPLDRLTATLKEGVSNCSDRRPR